MKIGDITGLGEPITKLIEVIRQGVGGISKPYLVKKNAEAKAYEIRQIADAIHDARISLGSADFQNEELVLVSKDTPDETQILLPERAQSRKEYQEQLEQFNTEQITSNAAEELMQEDTVVSEEKVDPDWIARFFDMAKNVSTEEMQFLWGKVLAGEVKQPNTFSLRTLELLRNLSRKEAEIFIKVAHLAIKSSDAKQAFILNPRDDKYLKDNHNVSFMDLLLLEELTLIVPHELAYEIRSIRTPNHQAYTHGDNIVIVKLPDNFTHTIRVRAFTALGKDLLNLVEVPNNTQYIYKFAELLKLDNTTVKLGTIVKHEGEYIHHSDLREITEEEIRAAQAEAKNSEKQITPVNNSQ
jgi:uncharacterized repeat protein (TIGR03899 family)